MLENLKKRWESEETKLGKKIKYYGGYLLTSLGAIIEGGDQLLSLFSKYNIGAPEWLTHGLIGVGLLAYIVGKSTMANQSQPSSPPLAK